MIATLSENRLRDLIRSLENLPNYTDDELLVKFDKYCKKLFSYVHRDFGIRFVGMVSIAGTIGAARFTLEGDRERAIQGLIYLNPVSITAEVEDLGCLVPNTVMCARAAWPEIAGQFERISPGELFDTIERVIPEVAFRPAPPATSETEALMSELNFQDWLAQNGLVDPSLKSRAVEQFREKEIAEQQAAEDRHKQKWYNQFSR